jgi:hypothetical protein
VTVSRRAFSWEGLREPRASRPWIFVAKLLEGADASRVPIEQVSCIGLR